MHPDTDQAISFRPAIEYPLENLAEILNRGFEGYFVNVNFNRTAILSVLTRDSVDLTLSAVVEAGSKPVAVALIARRGWSARLAAMGVVTEARAHGYGKRLLNHLFDSLSSQGLREFNLEVIEQNTPAIGLYEKAGFAKGRRLVSLNREAEASSDSHVPKGGSTLPEGLEEVDVAEVARYLTADSLPNLPWQLSGTNLMVSGPPSHAYQRGENFIVISDPTQPTIAVRTIFVHPNERRQGRGTELLASVLAAFPDRKWAVPALCPEEISPVFTCNGFQLGELSQIQMSKTLDTAR